MDLGRETPASRLLLSESEGSIKAHSARQVLHVAQKSLPLRVYVAKMCRRAGMGGGWRAIPVSSDFRTNSSVGGNGRSSVCSILRKVGSSLKERSEHRITGNLQLESGSVAENRRNNDEQTPVIQIESSAK